MDRGAESGGSERKGGEAASRSSPTAGRDTISQAWDAGGGGAESSGRSRMHSVWTLAACVLGCSPLLRLWDWFRRSRLDFRVT